MSQHGDTLATVLRNLAHRHGFEFFDLRGVLPTGPGDYKTRTVSSIVGLCFHHQASRPKARAPSAAMLAVLRPEDVPPPGSGRGQYLASIWGVAEYHVGADSHLRAGGAPGIAYTIAVDPAGGLYLLHDPETRTWSQGDPTKPGDENERWLGVLFLGFMRSRDFPDGDLPSPRQLIVAASLHEALASTVFPWWRPQDTTAHAYLGKPACPGDTLLAVVEAVKAGPTIGADTDRADLLDTWKERQAALNRVLVPSPGLIEDGNFGPKTKAALVRFQRAEGLTPDGVWGYRTEAALAAALDRLG